MPLQLDSQGTRFTIGGFYATWLAERSGCKAVLLNPAVRPAPDLSAHLGDNTQWHGPPTQPIFQAAYVADL